MKTKFIILALAVLGISFQSCSRKIEVKNTSSYDRIGQIVEIPVEVLAMDVNAGFVVRDRHKEIPSQLTHDADGKPKSLIFQVNVAADSALSLRVAPGVGTEIKSLTSARFAPERKDDFAWENDLGAYRMYGPALAKENPSNGVDFWLKKTSELIVDTFYYNELNLHKSYHIDWGKGLDLYKVGHTLGCGGIAPYLNDTLFIWNQFDEYKVIDNGPLRSTFKLTYNDVIVSGDKYTMEITISTDAGSIFNKAEVVLTGSDSENSMKLAAGIVLHEGLGDLRTGKNWTALEEDGVAEIGETPEGKYFVGMLVPSDMIEFKNQDNHALEIVNYNTSDTMTYYFGGSWSQWKYSDYSSWIKAIEQFDQDLENPLKVTVE